MENMNQLRDLLKHEIKDLYSAEEQIIGALPKMIENANNNQLKKALQQHLQVTKKQKDRLDEVMEHLGEESEEESGILGMFKGGNKCLAMEGIIKEGEKFQREIREEQEQRRRLEEDKARRKIAFQNRLAQFQT